MLYRIAEFVASFCYLGKSKVAPGTIGSLAAFPLCYLVMHYTLGSGLIITIPGSDPNQQLFIGLFVNELIITILLFIAGIYFTSIYIENMTQKDPKEVVIDEVVGQSLAIILSSFSVVFIYYSSSLPKKINSSLIDLTFLFLLPFILFRLFDIKKPWPINWLDANVKGSFGVMIDDVAAAIFAVVSQYVIVFIIMEIFPI